MQSKQWSEQNKERRRTMVECECGISVQLKQKCAHDRSKKHTDFIASKNNETVTTPPLELLNGAKQIIIPFEGYPKCGSCYTPDAFDINIKTECCYKNCEKWRLLIKNRNKGKYQRQKEELTQISGDHPLFNCACGSKVVWLCQNDHFRTKKHKDFVESQS